MGHAEPTLISLFNSSDITLVDLLDHPHLFDNATQKFVPELERLRTSWTKNSNWPYGRYVQRAHRLIEKAYAGKTDKSGDAFFHHPLNVADDAYRLCRLFGFSEKDATTVWIAGLCHDYIEDGKTDAERRARMKKLHDFFDLHDVDVFNLVHMLSNLDKTRPYFAYVQDIGKKSGFTDQSTVRAQIAALIIKLCDSRHNSRDDRNKYIALKQAEAEKSVRSSDPAEQVKATETLEWVEKKRTKILMYGMNMGLITEKLKHLLDPKIGLPVGATMVDFLLTDHGIPFRISNYARAREIGLGETGMHEFETRIQAQDEQQEHEILIDARAPANANTPRSKNKAELRPYAA